MRVRSAVRARTLLLASALLGAVGGTVMLALGMVIIFAPEVMHGLAGTLSVFLIALLLAAAIHGARRLATR